MLLPFQSAVLTVEEAQILVTFIESKTSTPGVPINFTKIKAEGLYEIYNDLKNFLREYGHYEEILRDLTWSQIKYEISNEGYRYD